MCLLKLESTNIITGSCLVIVALMEAWLGNIEGFFNWGIFAMMYLVMDDYKAQNHPMFRIVSGCMGVLLAIGLVIFKLICNFQ